jgi:hypothetical protein
MATHSDDTKARWGTRPDSAALARISRAHSSESERVDAFRRVATNWAREGRLTIREYPGITYYFCSSAD